MAPTNLFRWAAGRTSNRLHGKGSISPLLADNQLELQPAQHELIEPAGERRRIFWQFALENLGLLDSRKDRSLASPFACAIAACVKRSPPPAGALKLRGLTGRLQREPG
jgi:hypothetical protein